MSNSLVIEVSNGIIAVITAVTLYGVNRMLRWMQSVNKRLEHIEEIVGDEE